MSEELLIRRIKHALDVAPADAALRRRVIDSLPLERRQAQAPRRFWAPALAAALTVAVVFGLLWGSQFRSSSGRPSTAVPLSDCELPVAGGARTQMGFLDVSTGRFTPAASAVPTPTQTPLSEGPNAPAISYDRAAGVWLPVTWGWIAPDGMSYVYLDGSDIHIRYLRTQSDRVLLSGKSLSPVTGVNVDHGPFLIGWSGGLIYYTTRRASASDLWAVDPVTGRDRQVAPMQPGSEWWYPSPNAIWGSAYYSGAIARYDTKTHIESSWRVDGLVDMVGIDSAGNPIVLLGEPFAESGQLAIMHRNGTATPLASARDVFTTGDLTVVADGDRVWFSALGEKLWVYSPDTGLVLLDESANRSLPSGLVVAGGCVSKEEIRAQSSVNPAGRVSA